MAKSLSFSASSGLIENSANNSGGVRDNSNQKDNNSFKIQAEKRAAALNGKGLKTNKKSKIKKLFIGLLLLLLICAPLAYFGYKFATETNKTLKNIGFNATPLNPFKEPELKKDSTGKRTNALIIGIDTRENNSGLKNTDTLIVASFNHDTGDTTMISIPRDTYIGAPWYEKINGVYALGEAQNEGEGIIELKEVLEEYTDLEIQYWGMIDLQGFKKVIDTLGGVEINVENPFYDPSYPDEATLGYDPVSFKAGPQTMDGERALKFARSRQGTNGEGTDFARARRQQKVITAVKDKILTSETLLDPSKLLEILSAVQENVKLSEFTTEDIQAGIALLRKYPEPKTYSFVLDPNIGGLNSIIQVGQGDAYILIPTLGVGKHKDVQGYVSEVISRPALYSENATVMIYNVGLGYNEALKQASLIQEEYPYLNISYMGTLFSGYEGNYAYINSDEEKFAETLKLMQSTFKVNKAEKPDFISTSLNGEDVVILLGSQPVQSDVETDKPVR